MLFVKLNNPAEFKINEPGGSAPTPLRFNALTLVKVRTKKEQGSTTTTHATFVRIQPDWPKNHDFTARPSKTMMS